MSYEKRIYMKKQIGIIDIDGVVLDCSERLEQYVRADLKNIDYNAYVYSFNDYSKHAGNDKLIPEGIRFVNSIFDSNFVFINKLVAITSRSENSRHTTLKQLRDIFGAFNSSDLYMRPNHKEIRPGVVWEAGMPLMQSNADYKEQVLLKLEKKYDILWAIDDDLKVCEMYQTHGVIAIHLLLPGIDVLSGAGDK